MHYLAECEKEQAERLAGRIPTLDEYIENRLGTAAVYILCCINEYEAITVLEGNREADLSGLGCLLNRRFPTG